MLCSVYRFYKIIITIILLFVVAFNIQAQNESLEELITAIKNSTAEDSKAYELALLNLDITKKKISESYKDIGDEYYKNANYTRSQYYVDKAIHFAKMINDNKILSYAYLRLGNVFLQNWKNQQAIDAYYESINYSKKTKNKKHEELAQINLAIIFKRIKEYDKAMRICNSALKWNRNNENQVNLLTIKSEIHINLKQLDSSLYSAEKGIEMSNALSYSKGLIDLYIKQGIVYCQKKEYSAAERYLNKAQKVINDNKINNEKHIINLIYARANCLYERQEHEKAILELNRVVRFFKEATNHERERVLETYLLLSKTYKELGLVKESEDWLEKHYKLKGRFESNQIKTLNKIFKKDNEYLSSKLEALKKEKLKSKETYTYTLAAFSVGVLVLVLFLINYKRKQKSNKILFDKLLKKVSVLEATEQKNTTLVKEVVIDDTKVAAIIKGLDKLEQQEYYLNHNCNLRAVAKKVKTNATYLSKIINTHKNKNFNDYINDLRIDYTIKQLKNNRQFRSFSIKSIATEVGYKSDYSFAKHFKAKTGFNPSYYIKQIKKLEAEII